jgi:hypothetical protein
MGAFGVGTARVKAVEGEQVEAHRAEGSEAGIIEDSAHNMDHATGRDGCPDMPECLEGVVRRQDLQEGTQDCRVILPWERLVYDIGSADPHAVCSACFRDKPLRDRDHRR